MSSRLRPRSGIHHAQKPGNGPLRIMATLSRISSSYVRRGEQRPLDGLAGLSLTRRQGFVFWQRESMGLACCSSNSTDGGSNSKVLSLSYCVRGISRRHGSAYSRSAWVTNFHLLLGPHRAMRCFGMNGTVTRKGNSRDTVSVPQLREEKIKKNL